ncbi:MAG: hypothetical protein HKP58_05780, partial [Desulfatitalea sp.]|nr:hypothetical protein [Desulfatitalea sp.]NNJ99905.1 hypothetical protein [Desulfatitalea sp.]
MPFCPHKSIIGLLAVPVFLVLCFGVSPGNCSDEKVQEACKNLLKSLMAQDNPDIAPLLNRWADDLKASSNDSIDEHMQALSMLRKAYSQALSRMEQCLDGSTPSSGSYDPAWMEKFISHFGVPYLRDKEKSVLVNFAMVMSGSTERCCGPEMEKLIFKESVLYNAYRYLLNAFLGFYDKQSQEFQDALKTRKEAAENFLKLIDFASWTKVLLGGKPARPLSEIQARNSDKAIHDYFIANPPGCDINVFRAI